jgi:hypothetical protein
MPRIRAATGGKFAMHGIAQGDLRKLERGVERLAQCHVEQVSRKREHRSRTVLPVSVEAIRVEDAFDMLEESRVHSLARSELARQTG